MTSYSPPDKTDTLAHTLGVNVKASALRGHGEAQVHLCPRSGHTFAQAHTEKKQARVQYFARTRHKPSAFSHLEHTQRNTGLLHVQYIGAPAVAAN